MEAMMISCTIDVKEGLYVVVTDISGALLHANMDTDIHMLLEGTIAEVIITLESRLYRKYIWRQKWQANVLNHTQKGNIWHTTGSPTILEAIV